MRTGSLSLSINAIVVLILAIVVMAFALPFITDLFEKTKTGVFEQFPVVEIQATSENPIGIGNEFYIKPGEERKLGLNVYNNKDSTFDIDDVNGIDFECLAGSGKGPGVVRYDKGFSLERATTGQLMVVLKGQGTMVNNDICKINLKHGSNVISQQFFLVTK